jgi:hypothetical protein
MLGSGLTSAMRRATLSVTETSSPHAIGLFVINPARITAFLIRSPLVGEVGDIKLNSCRAVLPSDRLLKRDEMVRFAGYHIR